MNESIQQKTIIVLDCGATNVRAVAVSEQGKILAIHTLPNATSPDPHYNGGLIWDIDLIWQKLTTCVKVVLDKLGGLKPSAVTVTTFGVNGAPVDRNGKMLYPVISWQCQRTVPMMEMLDKVQTFEKIYSVTGIHRYSFNTLYTLYWLKQNHPELVDKMEGFLFITSLLIYRLSGSMVNDTTMAGTSMLTDIRKRKFSGELLNVLGLPDRFFSVEEPGTIVGGVTADTSAQTGLPVGIPVVLSGHDTQFALLGSGAGENEVVLSSGTWEILMTRSKHVETGDSAREAGLTNELDALPGLYNTGSQWLASGVLEWIKKTFFAGEMKSSPDQIYDIMINEGKEEKPDSIIRFNPSIGDNKAGISGIGLSTTRGEIYRAALQSLADKASEALDLLQRMGKFKAESLIVAGGGTKNKFWNQLRANSVGIPVKLVKETETTVIGAAINSMVALGVFSGVEEGVNAVSRKYDIVYPE